MTTATDTTRWHMTEAGSCHSIGTAPDATVGVHPADDDLGTAYFRVIEVIGGGEPGPDDFDRAERGGFAPIRLA